nr:hypothetical protein [uncultured Rhodococcus sp.]
MNESLKVVAETTVGSLVPTVFDAYARVQYPPSNTEPVAAWHVQLDSLILVLARSTNTPDELSPNLWWPADHTCCVAQHFDFPCAYLGGSTDTVSGILALTDIASSPVRVDQIITADQDENG